LYNETMSNDQFPKDVSVKQPPMNNFGMNYPILPSMTPSNQLSIMCAAAGPPAIPNPKAPQVLAGQVPSAAMRLAPTLAAELQGNTIDASNEFLDLLFPMNRAPFQINNKTFKKSCFTPAGIPSPPLLTSKKRLWPLG
jgi:hypothetical protein